MEMATLDFLVRNLVALGLGVVIGIERQLGQHPAGVRTNALVCLGAALFVSLPSGDSPTRVAAQIVSGIGFICGGAILREGISVRGMNTAATLWCTAAIGTLVGFGFWLPAVVGTTSIMIAHFLFRPIAHAIDSYTQGRSERELLYDVKVVCQRNQEAVIRAVVIERIKAARMRLQGLTMNDTSSPEQVEIKVHLYSVQQNEQAMNDLVAQVAAKAEVVHVSWKKAH
jgi:putative Mg2+ transporter-C (MgtC) family protein